MLQGQVNQLIQSVPLSTESMLATEKEREGPLSEDTVTHQAFLHCCLKESHD